MVHLEKVGYDNIWKVIELDVEEEQRGYVSPNIISIVDAYLAVTNDESAFPFAIYDDETLVGFIMVQFDLHDERGIERNNYTVRRLMIDKEYQHRGYGRQALGLALDFIGTKPCGDAEYCCISFKPWNTNAKKLYNSMGFDDTEYYDGDELIAVKKL